MPTTIDDVGAWIQQSRTNECERDWCFNECLANEPGYAKTDAQKTLVLWDARGASVMVSAVDGLQADHPWLHALFVRGGGADHVRFPWNPADSALGASLGPLGLPASTIVADDTNVIVLPRWSTASRSSLVLVPQVPATTAANGVVWEENRNPGAVRGRPCIHQGEWVDGDQPTQRRYRRFYQTVAPHLGTVTGATGAVIHGVRYRLYSIKTGVSYVGSTFEEPFGKNLLEENSNLAIIRSNAIRGLAARQTNATRDPSYRIQGELLTITAMATIGEREQRDGFQVRDVSCMRAGERYLPGHAIPYSGTAFSPHGNAPDADLTFWRNNFAIPCGRAKARMFLELGLIHMSANAQNFILAFSDTQPDTLSAFILRDIGDTSWHDHYVENVLGNGHPAYQRGFAQERGGPQRHLLDTTSNPSYPAPRLVRVAAFSVLTHDFAAKLIENRGWDHARTLALGQAILDGFRLYFVEAVGYAGAYAPNPADPGLGDDEIIQIGRRFAYPGDGYTRQHVTELTNGRDLLATARWIRHRSAALLAADRSEARVKALINAEEMAIGAHIDAFVRANGDAVRARLAAMPYVVPGSQEARLRPLTMYGSQTTGVKCGRCKVPHESRVSSVMGRWHRCTLCHTPYCNTCAKWHLGRNRWFTRTRSCAACNGETALME